MMNAIYNYFFPPKAPPTPNIYKDVIKDFESLAKQQNLLNTAEQKNKVIELVTKHFPRTDRQMAFINDFELKVSFIKSIYVHLNNNYVVRFSVIYVPQNYKECYWTANITIHPKDDNEYNAVCQFDPEDEKSYKIVYSYYMLST